MHEPMEGREPVYRSGFTYLPQFITSGESTRLIESFAGLSPIWEHRHAGDRHKRTGSHPRRLTRPVYWLGAWQFACLGYYAEPDYRHHRCLRAEGLMPTMQAILDRLGPVLAEHHLDASEPAPGLPNTCLINYYGRELCPGQPPRDYARLRMHRDREPGPVIMFCMGQPGLLEFIDPERSPDPELALWTRHRGVTVMSGPEFKDRLYHRISQVRTGGLPAMRTRLPNFDLRRVSVSFRYVPDELIKDLHEFPEESQKQILPYVEGLARDSEHFRSQLSSLRATTLQPRDN